MGGNHEEAPCWVSRRAGPPRRPGRGGRRRGRCTEAPSGVTRGDHLRARGRGPEARRSRRERPARRGPRGHDQGPAPAAGHEAAERRAQPPAKVRRVARRHVRRGAVVLAAKTIGVEPKVIVAARRDGKSVADVARAMMSSRRPSSTRSSPPGRSGSTLRSPTARSTRAAPPRRRIGSRLESPRSSTQPERHARPSSPTHAPVAPATRGATGIESGDVHARGSGRRDHGCERRHRHRDRGRPRADGRDRRHDRRATRRRVRLPWPRYASAAAARPSI